MYSLLRPLLFLLDPETGHRLALQAMRGVAASRTLCAVLEHYYRRRTPPLPVTVMGLDFPNPLGLAAGFDKDAVAIDAWAALGFGFVEVGTVTPRAQPGNVRPRMFRLAVEQAIINRMGFNNAGLGALARAVQNSNGRNTVLGINLGKNADTPLARALDDYLEGLETVYALAGYVTINVSSPNTRGLRELQTGAMLAELLQGLNEKRAALQRQHGRTLPLALKISPDLDEAECERMCETLAQHPVDALIATNTTTERPGSGCAGHPHAAQRGGLSGAPLREKSTGVVRWFHRHLRPRVPLIGVGGISNADDAWEKLCAGADLVQIYSALVYHGPGLVPRIVNDLRARVIQSGHSDLAAALAAARAEAESRNS